MAEHEHAALIASAIEHMNSEHAYNLRDYARGLAQLAWAEHAHIVALDRTGFTLHVEDGARSIETRIVFDASWDDAPSLRRAMVALAQRARTALQPEAPTSIV